MESAEKNQGTELHGNNTIDSNYKIDNCASNAQIVDSTDSTPILNKTEAKNVDIILQIQNEFTIIDNISEKLAYEYLSKFPLNFYTLSFKDKVLDKLYRQDRQDHVNNINLNASILIGILNLMFLITEIYTVFGGGQEYLKFSGSMDYVYLVLIPQGAVSILLFSYYAMGKSKYITAIFKTIFYNTMTMIVLPFIVVDIACNAVI